MAYVPGNIYLADVKNGSIKKVTNFETVEVQKLVWLPDGLRIAFVASLTDNLGLFEPKVITVDSDELYSFSENVDLVMQNDDNFTFFVWLTTSQQGAK